MTHHTYFKAKYRFEKPTENHQIVFYSSVGRRSDIVTKIALELGFKNAKSLYGGSRMWNKLEHAKNPEIDLSLFAPTLPSAQPIAPATPTPAPATTPAPSAPSTKSKTV